MDCSVERITCSLEFMVVVAKYGRVSVVTADCTVF